MAKDENILILWIGRLGDFAVSIKFINSLKQKYSDSNLILIGTKKNYQIAKITKLFNEIIIYPEKLNNPLSLLKIIFIYFKHILFKKYKMVIDLNPSYSNSSHYIIKYSNSLSKVGFYKRKTGNLFTNSVITNEKNP